MKHEKIEVSPEKQQPTPTEASNKFIRGIGNELVFAASSAFTAIWVVTMVKQYIEGDINSALMAGIIAGVAGIKALIELNKLVENKKTLTNYVASLEEKVDKEGGHSNK